MKTIIERLCADALIQRRRAPTVRIRVPVSLVLGGVALFILLAVLAAEQGNREHYFISDSGPVTALSAIFLAMASGLAAATYWLPKSGFRWSQYFWLLAALGFGFLAFDELLGFHEVTGGWIGDNIGRTQNFRNWNDVIVILYGIMVVPVLIFSVPEIIRYPGLVKFMAAAFACYFVHTLIDSTQEPRTTLTIILEESFKLYSSAFLAISMFLAVISIAACPNGNEPPRHRPPVC